MKVNNNNVVVVVDDDKIISTILFLQYFNRTLQFFLKVVIYIVV